MPHFNAENAETCNTLLGWGLAALERVVPLEFTQPASVTKYPPGSNALHKIIIGMLKESAGRTSAKQQVFETSMNRTAIKPLVQKHTFQSADRKDLHELRLLADGAGRAQAVKEVVLPATPACS